MKATAVACPIKGLIKYHGMKGEAEGVDPKLRLPFYNSISVCMHPAETKTTVEFRSDLSEDVFVIDGNEATGRARERCLDVVNRIRELSDKTEKINMVSKSNIKSEIGLGTSSSAFAALTLAASKAAGLDVDDERLMSIIARRGSGSSSRSLTGGISIWYVSDNDEDSYSHQIGSPEDFANMSMIMIPVEEKRQGTTEDFHREAVASPLFPGRVSYIDGALKEMQTAVEDRNIPEIGRLAEIDTISLHAVSTSGPRSLTMMMPKTIEICRAVRKWRNEDGIPAYYSVDTGASVVINTTIEHENEVIKRLNFMGITKLTRCKVGPGAKLVDDHLF